MRTGEMGVGRTGGIVRGLLWSMALGSVAWLAGCGGNGPASPARDAAGSPPKQTEKAVAKTSRPEGGTSKPKAKAKPLQLGGGSSATAASTSNGGLPNIDETVARLQPFQIFLGRWRWVTQKKFGDFPKTGEDLQWAWDFRSEPKLPSMRAKSEEHPYLKEIRLTVDPSEGDRYQAWVSGPAGSPARRLAGTWEEDHSPAERPDGKILQRSFKLKLQQVEPAEGEQWQLTLSLLDNDQFLAELKRRVAGGETWQQLDTVRQQREGTSFAVAESDNPGPKCVVSGGLGSMSVSYEGKTYPVCCSGCAAAFNDEPLRWLSKLKEGKFEGK
ncbi:MAG: hypothetical protein ACKOGA_02155 [Planctomycetaceae bacterium]